MDERNVRPFRLKQKPEPPEKKPEPTEKKPEPPEPSTKPVPTLEAITSADSELEIWPHYPYAIFNKRTLQVVMCFIYWDTLATEPQYEMLTGSCPIQIRHKETKHIVKQFYSSGRPSVNLGGKTYNLSRLMALEFIANYGNDDDVMHMERTRERLKEFKCSVSFDRATINEIDRLIEDWD